MVNIVQRINNLIKHFSEPDLVTDNLYFGDVPAISKPLGEVYNRNMDFFSYNRRLTSNSFPKPVQTAFSSTCLAQRNNLYNNARKTKSHEEMNKNIDTDLHSEITHLIEDLYHNKWDDKLKKLAEKLLKPNGEEKMMKKIKKYLARVSSDISDLDDTEKQCRKELSEIVLKRLKKLCFTSNRVKKTPIRVYRLEIPKPYHQMQVREIYCVKKIIRKWLEILPIKSKFNIKYELLETIIRKIEPLIENRPESERLFRQSLKWHIMEVLEQLTFKENFNRPTLQNQFANILIDEIIDMDSRNIKSINEHYDVHVKENKNNLHRNANISSLIEELSKFLYNARENIEEMNHENIKENVIKLLKDIVSESYADACRSRTVMACPSGTSKYKESVTKDVEIIKEDSINKYRNQVIQEINNWLTKLDIQIPTTQSGTFKDKAVRDLAEDIIDRQKYLDLNPAIKIKEDELQHIKYQIFKWINKVVGENNIQTIEHASELLKNIQKIPKPNFVKHQSNLQPQNQINENVWQGTTQSYSERVTEEVFDWLHELSIDLHLPEDVSLRTPLVSDLAKKIESGLKTHNNRDDLINQEVDKWSKNTLNITPRKSIINLLKGRIKNVPFVEDSKRRDHKQEKNYIRRYEDIIDEWMDNIPFEPKRQASFLDVKYELTHELALIVYKTRNKNRNMPEADIFKKIKDDVSLWLTKLPLQPHVNEKEFRDQFACKLIKSLQKCYLDESILDIEKQDASQFTAEQLEDVFIDWLKSLALYQNSNNAITKNEYEKTMRDFAKDFSSAIQGAIQADPNTVIIKYIKMLCVDTNQKDEFVQNIANQLRVHLKQLNLFRDLSQRGDFSDEVLEDNVKANNGDENKLNIVNAINYHSQNSFCNTPAVYPNSGYATNFKVSNIKVNNSPTICRMSRKTETITTASLPIRNNVKCDSSVFDEERSKIGLDNSDTNIFKHLQGMSIKEVYEYYQNFFKEKCEELPLETSTSEQKTLADLARLAIYNGIWKSYFNLTSDRNIANDYAYFEFMLEDRLENMLDCLPQTEEMIKIRGTWIRQILVEILRMLKYIQSISDRPSFKECLIKTLDRQLANTKLLVNNNIMQHAYIAQTVNDFILHSKYKEEDPVRANVYRQRLMKRVEELINYIKETNNVEFKNINHALLCRKVLETLKSVPVPNNDTLKDEADEILIGEEIKEWYNELPVQSVINNNDALLRSRMRELLAKKLNKIKKEILEPDSSYEIKIKHEVSHFLENHAMLKADEDLNINLMVEELFNRLKYKTQEQQLQYETFENEKPACSTFVQTEAGEVLEPLVDLQTHIQTNIGNQEDMPAPNILSAFSVNKAGNIGSHQVVEPNVPIKPKPGSSMGSTSTSYRGDARDAEFNKYCSMSNLQPPDSNTARTNSKTSGPYCLRHTEPVVSKSYSPGPLIKATQGFSGNQALSAATASTARVAGSIAPDQVQAIGAEEELEEEFNCRCMERLWRYRPHGLHGCRRRPRCCPLPFPCRYHY